MGGVMTWWAALVLTASSLACSDDRRGGTGGSNGGASAGGSVTQHHNHPSRDGVYIVPDLTRAAAATFHRDAGFNAMFDGSATAQPLFIESAGASDPDRIIVATLTNHVTAFDAETGAVLWDRALGTPAPRACNSAAPPTGIAGTPVIDLPRRTLYANA